MWNFDFDENIDPLVRAISTATAVSIIEELEREEPGVSTSTSFVTPRRKKKTEPQISEFGLRLLGFVFLSPIIGLWVLIFLLNALFPIWPDYYSTIGLIIVMPISLLLGFKVFMSPVVEKETKDKDCSKE